jgi:hypothetical protein
VLWWEHWLRKHFPNCAVVEKERAPAKSGAAQQVFTKYFELMRRPVAIEAVRKVRIDLFPFGHRKSPPWRESLYAAS